MRFKTMMLILALAIGGITQAVGGGNKLKLSDAYLLTFTKNYGNAALVSVQDLYKKGVGYALTGIDGGGTGISDNFVVPTGIGPLSGCTGPFNGDCSAFKKLQLWVKNLCTTDVDVSVYMNTGYTDPGFQTCSTPSPACDVYWQGAWTHVKAGKTKKVTLNFKSAEGFCDGPAIDDCTSGPGQPILRLDEVSNIGFQVADFDGGGAACWVQVRGQGGGDDNSSDDSSDSSDSD